MKICKTIKTGLHGFSVNAFAANFFDVNFFTGSGFSANLLSLIFFQGELFFCETMDHGKKHFVSGYIVPGEASKRKIVWSKRKLGGALLCLPYAMLRGFCVSSGDT